MYIIVLGGGIKQTGQLPSLVLPRLKLAKKLYGQKKYSIIVSGKYSFLYQKPYPKITEAEAMARVLRKMGIPKKDIILEKRARDTISNAYYLKKIINKLNLRGCVAPAANLGGSIIVITSNFHLSRVKFTFKKVFGRKYKFKFIGMPAKVSRKVIKHQQELLQKTKKFLYNMKAGDDQFLHGKFFKADYYQQARPTWVKKFVSQG